MKRLMLVAAAVASLLGLGALAAPSAQAGGGGGPVGPCATGIQVHLSISGSPVLDLCI